ncbi:MAG: DEAD/DEAH box helicase [Microcoleaceae cyanobacterium]
MAVLRGSWQISPEASYLFLWGEAWQRVSEAQFTASTPELNYPFAMEPSDLSLWMSEQPRLFSQTLLEKAEPSVAVVALPCQVDPKTEEIKPIYSSTPLFNPTAEAVEDSLTLYPWQLPGIRLDVETGLTLLQTLPLGGITATHAFLGEDVRFWSHVARWILDLLVRGKFLPNLQSQEASAQVDQSEGQLESQLEEEFLAQWLPLLDSATDQARLLRFAKYLPTVCRMYQPHPSTTAASIALPLAAEELLSSVLQTVIDDHVRQVANDATVQMMRLPKSAEAWLHALGKSDATVSTAPQELDALATTIRTWLSPLQPALVQAHSFRAGFRLSPPTEEGETQNWLLEYCLQAIDEPELVIDAATLWQYPVETLSYQGRLIQAPQETLLRGLGIACRLYPPLEKLLEEIHPQSCELTPIEAYTFIKDTAWRFADSGLGVILPPSLAHREGWANRLGLSLKSEPIKLDGKKRLGLSSLLNFQWKISIGGQTLNQAEFEQLISQGSPLVEVNGEWVELQPAEVRSVQNFFTSRENKMELSLEDALRLATGDTQTIDKLPVVRFEAEGRLQEILQTLTHHRALEPIETPESFKGELRPYQAKGVGWLAFLEQWGLGACLADDMGLGKTIELIAFLLHLQEEETLTAPVLLVCPTSVLGNWEREVKRFAPSLKALVHHGEKRAKGKQFAATVKKQNLVITSYSLTVRDEKDLKGFDWQGIVLDEAQNIKNPQAKQSKTIREIQSSFKIALTGTPVENRLSELWSIMDFLNPGYLGQLQFFQRRFAVPIERYGDIDSLKTLRSLVQPFILRRLKTDKEIIQDLPEKQENTIFCPLSADQANLYQKTVDEFMGKIEEIEGIQRHGLILALLVRLKQICNHPVLVTAKNRNGSTKSSAKSSARSSAKSSSRSASKTSAKLSSNASTMNAKRSGKLQRLHEMLEEILAQGDRALIFTQFSEWGKLLQPYLEHHLGCKTLFLYGATRKAQREEMVDRFQNDPQGPPILILSLKAGGVGLNLTRANHVFHFDRWWNPAIENQATDRAFRIGQTRNVQVHKFVCSGTLEEKIHELIESKKALAEQIVETGENWLTEMNSDQLRDLLILDRSAVIEEAEEA